MWFYILCITPILCIIYAHYYFFNRSCRNINLVPVSETNYPLPSHIADWIQQHDFSYAGCYSTTCILVPYVLFCWQKDSVYFCTYMSKSTSRNEAFLPPLYDFVTMFEDEIGLTTSPIASHTQSCQPGYYKQSFSKPFISDLWECHCTAESFLKTHGARLPFVPKPFVEVFEHYIKSEAEYIRTRWFGVIRFLYGSLLGKYFWHNKTIEMQYKKHMIILPDELS